MLNFQEVSPQDFLRHYWQKKPLVIRNALPHFNHPISPDDLAALALEEEMESRIVIHTPEENPSWHLQRGPFIEEDFNTLPASHWTLLVQGIDRIDPDVYALLDDFDFLPQWRLDDVMISFASQQGTVGPHYDNYDVFLYQAKGRREWRLTTQQCHPENYLEHLELRIMREFAVEQTIILEEGDMLYLPPHVGHYGISLSDECLTYSFGYRSYQAQEIWESLGDFAAENEAFKTLYQDPDWSELTHTSELIPQASQQAKQLLQELLSNDELFQSWFGCFATRLDQNAEQQLPFELEEDELLELPDFIAALKNTKNLLRDTCCRFAYQNIAGHYVLYINGCEWGMENVSPELVELIANNRFIQTKDLLSFLSNKGNQQFLYELWTLQWLQFID